MANVLLSEINKSYKNGVQAVRNFNLEIREGEFIIFVGPSGCGKSTTLRMIAGLESITSGDLYINGILSNYLEPGERNLSMVFQNYALYPYMTVYENMAFSLRCAKADKTEIDRRVREAAALLQIDHLLSRKPAALSGGQKQRVAIGSVLVRHPRLFLMDEPLSNLDAKLRTQMRIELAKLHERLGATIIYVTHDQVEAMTLGDRIVVMKDGAIQQVASPYELYHQPVNQFVAGFIGSPAMNFFEVRVSVVPGHLVLDYGTGSLSLPPIPEQKLKNRGYLGKKLILGLRPEEFLTGGEERCRIPMDVEVVENLGAEILLHGTLGGMEGCVKLPSGTQVAEGGRLWLYPDMTMAKYFDCGTGDNILYTGGM